MNVLIFINLQTIRYALEIEVIRVRCLLFKQEQTTASTLCRYRDHLWVLGGRVIRRQEDPDIYRRPVGKATFALLEEDSGPLIWPRITQQEQDAFDASCRKFYGFLMTASDKNPS